MQIDPRNALNSIKPKCFANLKSHLPLVFIHLKLEFLKTLTQSVWIHLLFGGVAEILAKIDRD